MVFEAKGQKEYPPHFDVAEEVTYKTVNGTKLNLWIFTPENHKLTDNVETPVILTTPGQFKLTTFAGAN